MSNADKPLTFMLGICAACFTLAVFVNGGRRASNSQAMPPPEKINASVAAVIGLHADWLGDAQAPFTLVEFGDYECPPCRQIAARIPALLDQHRGNLKFVFRNLPLTKIHPYAMQAAATAEAAREQGRFWPVHDRLYRTEVNPSTLAALPNAERLDPVLFHNRYFPIAMKRVQEDMRVARKLHLNGTPNFLLCCPDGGVLQLFSLDQLKTLVK